MSHQYQRYKLKKFPYYLLPSFLKLLKAGAAVVVLVILLTIVDSIGQTFSPKITVDAFNADGRISSDLYGYSLGSDFKTDEKLNSALRSYPVDSIRLTAPFSPGKRFITKIDNGVNTILASDNVAYEADRDYEIMIEAINDLFKIYVDNKLIFETRDNRFANGETALISSYNKEVRFDDVKVSDPSGKILFEDNFNNGSSPFWNHQDFPSFHDNGVWQSSDGYFKHEGQQNFALKKAGERGWRNYILKARIKNTSLLPWERGFMGLMFRYQDPHSGYRFLWQSDLPAPYNSNNPWEVVDFASQVKAAQDLNLTPNVVVNLHGTPENAAQLVRFLNLERGLNVKYFELGNEIWAYGENYMPPDTYAAEIIKYAAAMKAVDPTIKVGASLLMGFSHWDIPVIQKAGNDFDFIILHHYLATQNNRHLSNQQLFAASFSFARRFLSAYSDGNVGYVEQTKDAVKKYAPSASSKMEYVLTEFNTFDPERGKNLSFGLAAAEILGESAKQNLKLAQFHALGTSASHWHSFTENYSPRPAALALSMFKDQFGEISLPLYSINVPSFEVGQVYSEPKIDDVPYLSAFASRSADDKKIFLAVINKHELASMETELSVKNAIVAPEARVYTLSGSSLNSNNEENQNVVVTEKQISFASDNFKYTFPPRSLSIVQLNILLVPPEGGNEIPRNNSAGTEILKPKTTNVGTPLETNTNKNLNQTKIAVGAKAGGNPHVKTFDENGNPAGVSFFAYNRNFRGGVNVALADINNDAKPEIITGAGKGGGPHLRVFDLNKKELFSFFPFHQNFRGGINVAAGDVDGDGQKEIAAIQATKGQAWIKVYKANKDRKVVATFNAFGKIECGGNIALGDVDGDGKDEIIVGAGLGGGPQIKIYNEKGQVQDQFFAFEENYRNGLSVATGKIDADNREEIIVGQNGRNKAMVKIFKTDKKHTLLNQWQAYGEAAVGASLATTDLDNDGKDEIITGTGYGAPHVLGFEANGRQLKTNFFAFDKAFRGGISVAGK